MVVSASSGTNIDEFSAGLLLCDYRDLLNLGWIIASLRQADAPKNPAYTQPCLWRDAGRGLPAFAAAFHLRA